jgi:hypothetical protein
MLFNRKFAAAFASGLLFAGVAAAEPLATHPAEATTTDLGNGASALTYWVDAADGRHVVTTVDTVLRDETGRDQDRHAVVRFSSILLPGQSQVVSVPTLDDAKPQDLVIRRSGDRIEVERVASATVAGHATKLD